MEKRADALLASVIQVELGLRKTVIPLSIMEEIVESRKTLAAPPRPWAEELLGPAASCTPEQMASFRKSIASLQTSLDTSRAQVATLEAVLSGPPPPALKRLLAWRPGEVAGNVTPAASKEELELKAIEAATDPSHRALLMLALRAAKLVDSLARGEAVARGRLERPAHGSMGPAHLPALIFTGAQRAAASKGLDNASAEIDKLDGLVTSASATSSVPAAHVGLLVPHLEYLRSWTVSRAYVPFAPPEDGSLAMLRTQKEELAAVEQKMRAAERAHAAVELSEQAAAALAAKAEVEHLRGELERLSPHAAVPMGLPVAAAAVPMGLPVTDQDNEESESSGSWTASLPSAPASLPSAPAAGSKSADEQVQHA